MSNGEQSADQIQHSFEDHVLEYDEDTHAFICECGWAVPAEELEEYE